ncbi:hypothetical protein BDB00DRAFT_832764 [Zychaea mexicana]|uniref:uncharacterized protein n=1 Tax=Zychaea mexicana TaxID=64656 RepID=UPI0022FE665A|nr:uncharacterized protein BDB00DRAFT_832764 [Zychaea mexicana]KAI9491388.1 hypothetical protein BDB00DRAFT_832764 [Zychaea mexicana]
MIAAAACLLLMIADAACLLTISSTRQTLFHQSAPTFQLLFVDGEVFVFVLWRCIMFISCLRIVSTKYINLIVQTSGQSFRIT